MAKAPVRKTGRVVMARVPDSPHTVTAPSPAAVPVPVEIPYLAAPDTLLVVCQMASTLMTRTPAPSVEEAVTQAIACYVEAYLRLRTVR